MRTIAHLDADAFYVSVELLRAPQLRGQPVVVSGTGPRAVVTTASYEARRFGVFSAIPASRARRLCPQAVFLRPDFPYYREKSAQVMTILRETIDVVEIMGLDEAYLDLSGLSSPRSEMRRLVSRIERETGITCSVGIGPNRLVAKVASDAEKPRGLVMLSREEACSRFAASPPRLLPGIGPRTAERLGELGIETLAQLRTTPVETLVERFGPRHGTYLKARASFEDDTPLQTVREPVSRSAETTFDTDVSDPERMQAALRELAGRLCRQLADRDLRGRSIGIKVRLDDFSTVTRARSLPRATNDVALVAAAACELLAAYAPTRPVRLLGVRVAALDDERAPVADADQLELFA